MIYRRDIDGLRALAVVPVILFHVGVPFFSGGYVGVDVFFVISGFLITSLISLEMRERRFSFSNFYERRIRRIFPNLFLMLGISALVAIFVLIPISLAFFGESLSAASLSASNVYFFLKSNYFDPSSAQSPLLNTWSLAVEEQYYLFFPIILALVQRKSQKTAYLTIVFMGAASFLCSVIQIFYAPTADFFLPFSRWWELLVGSAIATQAISRPRTPYVNQLLAFGGFLMILAGIFLFNESTPFPGPLALLPVLGSAAIIAANGQSDNAIKRILSLPIFVIIGRYSYSLYLWHWPVIVFYKYFFQRALTPIDILIVLLITIVLSLSAYFLVEKPLRRSRAPGQRSKVFVGAFGAIVMFSAIGFSFWLSRGWPERYPPAIQKLAAAADDTNPLRKQCDHISIAQMHGGGFCIIGSPTAPVTFAFVGDSFADAMIPGVTASAIRTNTRGLALVREGTLPLAMSDKQSDYWANVFQTLASRSDVDTIIIASRWSAWIEGTRFGLFVSKSNFVKDALSKGSNVDEGILAIKRGFDRTTKLLSGKRVIVLAFMPEQQVFVPQQLTLRALYGGSVAGISNKKYQARQAKTHKLLNAVKNGDGIIIIDASKLMCNKNSCPITEDGKVLYADDNHPSRTGAIFWSGMFDSSLLQSRSK